MNGKKILFGAACDGLLLFLMRGAPIKYAQNSTQVHKEPGA